MPATYPSTFAAAALLVVEKKLEIFCAMAKASLDTCLSSFSPKLMSDNSRKRSKGTCGTKVSPHTAEARPIQEAKTTLLLAQ